MWIGIGPRLKLATEKFSKSFFKQSSYEQGLSDLIQDIRTQSQRFDTCTRLCSYESIRHIDDTVVSHRKESRNHTQEIVGELGRLKVDQFQQNNLLSNIVVTEAGNLQHMMGVLAKSNEVPESKIKELIEVTVQKTLENLLSSNDRMKLRTQYGTICAGSRSPADPT